MLNPTISRFRFIYKVSWVQIRTLKGHTNEKNFVGLSVNSEYIACGSETNEVVVYHKVISLSWAQSDQIITRSAFIIAVPLMFLLTYYMV